MLSMIENEATNSAFSVLSCLFVYSQGKFLRRGKLAHLRDGELLSIFSHATLTLCTLIDLKWVFCVIIITSPRHHIIDFPLALNIFSRGS